MPLTISKKFSLNSENASGKKLFKDVQKRFNEYTQTYEFIMKFNNNIEKTDESSINLDGNQLGEEIDQKERRRYVRKEIKAYSDLEIFQIANESV